jgi:hypothetical protein
MVYIIKNNCSYSFDYNRLIKVTIASNFLATFKLTITIFKTFWLCVAR